MVVRQETNRLSGRFKGIALFRNRFSNERRTGIFPVLLLFVGVFLFSAPVDVLAATRIWGGGSVAPGTGGDYNWSTATHWTGDTVPQIGDDVIFRGSVVTTACTVDACADALGSFTVESDYDAGQITVSNWALLTVNLSIQSNTAGTNTLATANSFWISGNISCSNKGGINQTAAYTVMRGTTSKTITNTGTGTLTFYKFEENSDTNGGSTAKTTISCNISVGADGMYTNNWNQTEDGYLIIDTGVTVTVSGNYYNKGKTETKSGSFVKVVGDIELDYYIAGTAQNQAWGFITTNGGTFEWTGTTADKHVWPNSSSTHSKFYDFKKSGSSILYLEKYPLYTLNDFTVTAGTCIETAGMYIGDAAGDDIVVTTGGRLEAKKFMTVAGNITLEDDNTLFWGVGDGYPTVVTFGGTFSCEAGTTAKLSMEWCTDEGGGTKYFKLVGAAGGIRSFTGSNSQFEQILSLGVCHVYLDNIYLDLTDTLTRTADQKITLAGSCQFDAITLNGDADTLFDTGAFTATVGGAFLNTAGTVTISAGGGNLDCQANSFTSNTANSVVNTSGNLSCGDLNIGGTFTNTATNTIYNSGNITVTNFSGTTTNNTTYMTGGSVGKYINSTVNLGNLVINSGTTGNPHFISTNNLTLNGTFTVNAGKYFTTNDGVADRNLTTAGTIDIDGVFRANSSTIRITGNANFDAPGTTAFEYGTSTVDLDGTGQIVCANVWASGVYFYNLQCAAAGKTTTATGGMTIYNVLTLGNNTGALTTSDFNNEIWLEKIGGSPLVTAGAPITAGYVVYSPNTAAVTTTVASATYNAILAISPDATATLETEGAIICSNLYIYGQQLGVGCVATLDTTAANHGITVNGNTYLGDPWADPATRYGVLKCNDSTIDINGDVYIRTSDAGGTDSIDADTAELQVSGTFSNLDTFTCDTSTLKLDGATTPVTLIPGSSNIYNLTIDKTLAADTVNVTTNALNVTGALDIQDGTLNLATTTTITGAVSVGNGAGAASTLKSTTASLAANFNDDVTIASDGTFDFQAASMTLKFDNEAGDLVDIAASGSFVVKGTAGNLSTLSNDSGTDKWHIHNGNAQDQSANLAYITPSYSDASGGTNPIQPATTATDGGNNINWVFGDSDAISGTVYQDQGSTIITENCPIVMYLYYTTGSTLTQTATAALGVGTYSFTGLNLSAGDVATIYIHDQASGWEGCTTYRSDADGAADVNIYKDHVIIHSDSGSMTNTNMSNADDGDTDIKYNVAAGVLTVEDNFEAYIFGGTFQPGGGVIVDDININNGAFTMEANAVTVSGTWITGASGAFTSTGTVTFDSAAATEQITSHGESFNAVTFNNPAGTGKWTLQDTANFGGATSVTKGEFITGANALTIGGTLTVDGGTATFTNATSVDCNGSVALSAGTLTATNNTMNVAGDWTISGTGAFTCGTGTVEFDGAAVQTVKSNSKTYNKITVTNASAAGIIFREAFTTASFEDTTASTKLSFKEGRTYTITGAAGSFNLNGQATGTRITVDSEDSATQFTLDFTGAAQTINYVNLDQCIAGTNAGTAYNSVDGTHNTNWTFNTLSITTPTAGSTVNQQPTIVGTAGAGDNISIKYSTGGAYTEIATAVADAAGNYRVRQANYTGTMTVGAGRNLRCDVGANLGTPVAVTVSATPTTNQTPTITSPADGGTVNGSTPTLSGKGLAGQNVTLTANDANGNLLLTQVVAAAAGVTVDANGNWTITSGNYTTPLVKGINYLSVTVGGVASNITTVTFTDPFGVVFDSVTNNPIANATVTIFNQNGTRCTPGVEIAAGDANPQTTGADGAYNFLTINGNFYITVSATGYTYPSTMTSFPAGRVIVNGSRGEVFNVAGVIIQMDHPMDGTDLLLKIKKTANKKEAVIGDIVTYTVTIQNVSAGTVTGVYLADQIPGGFKYIKGKAILDNVPLEPSGNRPIIFDIGNIAAGATRTLKYQLVIGSGVTQGKYENTAWAQYSNGRIISNKDRQTVKVVLDPLFDLGTIIGKVFWDRNQSGAQEAPKKTDEEIEAETGIAGVQIAMEDGTVVTTDKEGKYHIQSVVPGRHLLRINERTLPDGAYLTTDKVIVIDTTPGLLSKVNFGVNSKDKGRKETEKEKAPVKILQKQEKVKPFLNVSLYPSSVISYTNHGFEVHALPYEYEFRIFTNYSLFIKRWKLEILDKDTKALVRGFSGTHLTLSEPIYWDGKSKDDKWLDPGRNYVYVLSVMDKTGRTDTTRSKDLKVTGYEPKILDRSKAESQRLKDQWIKEESRTNKLDTQNIKLSNKVVVIESKGGFETTQETPLEPKVKDTSQINIMVDDASVPVVAPAASGEEFTQEIVVPEGEHKVTVEAVDKEGKQSQETQYIKDKDNYLMFVAMGDAKGGYTFQRGSIEPIMHDDKYRDGFWSEGKLAYYLKGKILGKYLVTSSLDTDRENKALFRNLDPNKYYPVYGDASKVNYDATNTQGMLYLLVEWDKSSALWGNYNVNFKDTDFATFSRSLYGANVNYETVSTTRFGEPDTKLVVFKATAKQQAAHNEFVGTGGSLFYLKNKDVIEGSEKVAIEVRDKITGLVLATLKQEEGFDYHIDYDNGRIMFWEPVSHIAETSSIVSSALLNGNPVYVVVDYEYETLDKYDEGVYGARAEQSITDYVRLGGTYIREDQQSKNYGLAGVDTTLHLGTKTDITGEFAQSKAQELGRFISTDGGLTFEQLLTDKKASGRAYGVKGESHLFDKLGVSGYYKKIEKDFSSISTASQQGKQLIGAAVTYDITPKTRITAKHDIQELLADGNPQTQLQVGAKKTETTTAQITQSFDKLKLTGEYRHQKVEDKIEKYKSETNENGDILAGRADYKATEKVSLFLEQQASIKGSPNNQTTAGIDTKLNEYVSLRGKETVGTRGNATSVGAYANITDRFKISSDYTLANYKTGNTEKTASVTAKAKVDENSEVYNTYSQTSSAFEGKKNSSVFGAKKTLNSGLELSMEEQQASSKREVSDTNIFGVSGNVNDKLALTAKFERGIVQDFDGTRYNRNAPSLALSYADKDKIKASLKAEARFDRAQEDKRQYLLYAAIEDKINPDLTLFAKANVSNSANTTRESTLAFYKEFTLGTAYRPVNFDRLNLLARYNYLSNTAPTQQIDIKDVEGYKAHILSGEAAYDLTDHWQIIQKLALRIGEEKVTGFEFTKTRTWLTVSRLNYNINRDWQVGAEYRRLAQSQAKDAKQGALIELAKNIGEYVQAGVGYNFTDFTDDLTSLDYTAQGPFVRLTGKLFDRTPEEIERLKEKREEEHIKQWVNELVNYELVKPDSEIAQELRHYYHVAEKAQQAGKLQMAKRYYAKVIQAGNMMKQEADEYVRKRVELEKTLARDDELAKAYYKEGRLEEAKQLWEKIIKEVSVDNYPAKW